MSDVACWIKRDPDGIIPSMHEFYTGLREIIADELQLESPGKVDVLHVLDLYVSDSKRVVLHVYGYPNDFANTTPEAIAARVKSLLRSPGDEQCVAVNFLDVNKWGKA